MYMWVSRFDKKLLIAEIILLLASVLVFRSLWLLMDRLPILHEPSALIGSLVVAIAITIPALRYVIRHGRH